jgi:hypothetical protein
VFFRRKKKLTREQSLKSVPVKNQHVEESQNENGEYILFLPRKDTRWIKALSKLMYVPEGKKMALDELGSQVWGWIDGETNTGKLIKKFADKHDLSKREAELSVVAYLRMLAKKGLIGIAVTDSEAGNSQNQKKKRKVTS